jgi:hypothetical protein
VPGEIELIDHAAEQLGIDLPTGSNETGADFDDYAHLVLGCGEARTGPLFAAVLHRPGNTASRERGQLFYRAVRMGFLAR